MQREFYERLIELIKVHINKTIGKTILNIDDYYALITKIKHTYTLEDIENTLLLKPKFFRNIDL